MRKDDLIKSLKNLGFSEKIIKAFENINRENFVPLKYKAEAYKDIALPIGKGQTISQPYTIAFMLGLLELQDNQKIMEIGSGSGYVVALINSISKNSEIYGVELIPELVKSSREVLKNRKNIHIFEAKKNELGLVKEAEKKLFDRILVSASSDKIPQKLLKQLKIGGILVVPVKDSIIKIKKFANENKIEEYSGFVFVPLIEG